MDSVWFTTQLADEVIKNDDIFEQTKTIVADIVLRRLDVTNVVENLAGVLTSKEAAHRERGMKFFTKILKELPTNYLTEKQISFISKFYIDRLKDNHRVIPPVIEGYLAIIDMDNYNIQFCGEFFTILFREVPCQSQVRQDRYHIYLLFQKSIQKNPEYMRNLGPDFVYGVISAMDGERDPRNLLFLFGFLPIFLATIPLGHLVEEMFDVISCYYPIDFHPSPNDPAAVSRDDLAAALCPCLCAVPEFAQHCLVLLVEKLDSSLRLAKIDSLKLLTESCKNFKAESYVPFLKTLWSSIFREISHKTDDELKLAAHKALAALVAKLSTTAGTDQSFENFIKGILISMQTALAESSTVLQFLQAAKILLTVANASKQSCELVNKSMIPAILAYYEFKTSSRLQVASLEFLGDLYELAEHWNVLKEIEKQVDEIPQLCLTATSQPSKEYQIAGFKTLMRVKNALKIDCVVPFIEILIYLVQNAEDHDLLKVCVETVHVIARRYPEIVMNTVVKGKCDIDNLSGDKIALQKRLNLLSHLASVDDFTKLIISEMLKLITTNNEEASKVVAALNGSLSDENLYTDEKIAQIESDHGLIDSILTWLMEELKTASQESLPHGYNLVSKTLCSLPSEKQLKMLSRHTKSLMEKCKIDELYYPVLQCLYLSINQDLYNEFIDDIMVLSLKLALNSESKEVRNKACILIAHFLNKAEHGLRFELLYEMLKEHLSKCSRENNDLCPKLINLYGWITKALIMRGTDLFKFWLQKITICLFNSELCKEGSEAIRIIMQDSSDCLNTRQHCRTSILFKQRLFNSFSTLMEQLGPPSPDVKEAYYLSWGYILEQTPKSVLNSEIDKIISLVVDSLIYDNKDLLAVMLDVLIYFAQSKHAAVAQSLQSILPRLVNLTTYVKSMDVRIKSLQCLYEIANSCQTVLLLPYKQDLLLSLAPSLDDKKRLVRNEAVRARTRWFLVGAPGEPKES